MSTPTITYKGELRELRIGNAAMMRFTRLGGQLDKMEADPIGQGITMLCAILDLPGDPLDHADDFPTIPHAVEALKGAISGYTGEQVSPGEAAGVAAEQSAESATD